MPMKCEVAIPGIRAMIAGAAKLPSKHTTSRIQAARDRRMAYLCGHLGMHRLVAGAVAVAEHGGNIATVYRLGRSWIGRRGSLAGESALTGAPESLPAPEWAVSAQSDCDRREAFRAAIIALIESGATLWEACHTAEVDGMQLSLLDAKVQYVTLERHMPPRAR